jgi:hypothetical protein
LKEDSNTPEKKQTRKQIVETEEEKDMTFEED